MHRTRILLAACALVAAYLLVPAHASAATAPTLKSPAANAESVTEGGSIKFEWTGALQGDPTALDRSFFRVEVISSANMPSGAQSEWPESKLENSIQTEPGSDATTASLGVPPAGEYRWRVCAWGVADVLTNNVIEQLPGGCSASRPMTTVAAKASSAVSGELKMETRTQVSGGTRTVVVTRPADPAPVEPAPQEPAPPVQPAPVEEVPPAIFQDIGDTSLESGEGSALGGLGGADQTAGRDAEGSGVGGTVIGALGANLPFVPIPFWTLALLLACVPLLRVWRRSVLGMFDWSDGSIDGMGNMGDVHGTLAPVPVASEVKLGSTIADGDAPAPAPSAATASDRRRPAA